MEVDLSAGHKYCRQRLYVPLRELENLLLTTSGRPDKRLFHFKMRSGDTQHFLPSWSFWVSGRCQCYAVNSTLPVLTPCLITQACCSLPDTCCTSYPGTVSRALQSYPLTNISCYKRNWHGPAWDVLLNGDLCSFGTVSFKIKNTCKPKKTIKRSLSQQR